MIKIKKIDHKYLIDLYYSVGEYLSASTNNDRDLPNIIVSFCTVCEKVFKLILYRENPVLIFDVSRMKDDDSLVAIIKKNNKDIETIKMRDTVNRFRLFFKEKFSEDEMQSLLSLYNVRNELIHGHLIDEKVIINKDDVIKKMGTIWEKISKEVIFLFGKNEIKYSKPKNKYTESELEKVLVEEVRKKIKNENENLFFPSLSSSLKLVPEFPNSLAGHYSGKKCPRCGSYNFALKKANSNNNITPDYFSGIASLYLCNNCNLELTQKEYEIAEKIKRGSL